MKLFRNIAGFAFAFVAASAMIGSVLRSATANHLPTLFDASLSPPAVTQQGRQSPRPQDLPPEERQGVVDAGDVTP